MKNFLALLTILFFCTSIQAQELSQTRSEKYSVYFDFDKHTLTQNQLNKLKTYIDSLGNIVILSISLEGYCDDRGTVEYNRALSIRRANTVENILGEIASKQRNVEGKGKIDLRIVDMNDFELETKRLFNRRVDIYLEYFHNDYVDLKKPIEELPTKEELEIRNTRVKTFEDKPLKPGDIITMKNLYFEGGKAKLLKKSEKQLDKLLKQILDNPNIKFEIQGHVCCIDTNYFRDAVDEDTGINNLSESRALSIYNFLKSNGISDTRMTYKGYGRDYPLLNAKEKDNKRVEILITGTIE
jgi:outer membrane protein OmpA-like peptidoglycan-associated protein